MEAGFEDYFKRFGEWPWKTAKNFRNREMLAGALLGGT
jgi:hypothetical protein